MKKLALVVLVLISFTGLFLLVSSPSSSDTQTITSGESNFSEIQTAMNTGTPLIDVRTPEEFQEGHIQGAVNLPLDRIYEGSKPNTELTSTVYVYCRSGNRSKEAKAELEKYGFTNIVDLGGINEVIALGAKQVR